MFKTSVSEMGDFVGDMGKLKLAKDELGDFVLSVDGQDCIEIDLQFQSWVYHIPKDSSDCSMECEGTEWEGDCKLCSEMPRICNSECQKIPFDQDMLWNCREGKCPHFISGCMDIPTRCLLCEEYLFLNSDLFWDCPACDKKADRLDLELQRMFRFLQLDEQGR